MKTEKCPIHNDKMEMTDWKPTLGLNPMMRQFVCKNCLQLWYLIIKPQKEEIK